MNSSRPPGIWHYLAKTKSLTFTCSATWHTPEPRQLKAQGQRLELLSRKTGPTIHKDRYYNHPLIYKEAVSKTKSVYYAPLILMAEGNTCIIFSTVYSTLRPLDTFASHMYSSVLCQRFMDFSTGKSIHHQQPSPYNSFDYEYSSIPIPPHAHSLASVSQPLVTHLPPIQNQSLLHVNLILSP